MNPDTRVVVHCYEGDQTQVCDALDLYAHHDCPVSVFSPADAPALIPYPAVNSHAGMRAQSGPQASERHLQYLKMLLDFPEHYFLMHESDSVCLDPHIPDYLYTEPVNILWGNCTIDQWGYWTPQAPWFFSRFALERLIAAAETVTYDPKMAWVDHYLIKLCTAAGIECRKFEACCCVPMGPRADLSSHTPDELATYRMGYEIGANAARDGACMMHSIKNAKDMRSLAEIYRSRQ